ncbi:hypothetical protein Ahp1_44 [Aeromonas phage Ahp1]|uniref:Uncharacterized protein n=1 Tax=Aeromonas phage Ahp1 TaxID=1747286 RepID=A0A1S5Q8F9_9CAUD|nr:recombinase [Aeromonas phage Ahp1]ALP47762.1 hypothetical protein Ahp1_44 [Aeromonas phage Ahp1]
MRTELPYLPALSCGAALRGAVSHLLDYVRVNASTGNTHGPDAVAFFDNQLTLATATHGDPADGLYLGCGVPDTRIHFYKALSEIRLNRDNGGSGDGLTEFTRFITKAKAIAAAVPHKVVATTSLAADPVDGIPDKNGQSV